MNYNKKRETDKMNTILTTTDYDGLKFLKGNRPINKAHLNNLIKSMKQRQLFTTGIVNEKDEICDGQHRFMACKTLEKPFYYTVEPGYGLEEVVTLNTRSRTWNNDNYLNSYLEREGDYPEYIRFKQFMDKYKMGYKSCIGLLTNSSSINTGSFNNGTFKIKGWNRAVKMADMVMQTAPYYARCRTWNYVLAMVILFNNKDFQFERFLKRLDSGGSRKMMTCSTIKETVMMIEEIYNFRSKEKVRLY
tara:strand:- start:72 stop:812 length:741 start_codon:yes stop_codon:yes gene_type:complete